MVNRDGQTPRIFIELEQVEGEPDGVAYPVSASFLPPIGTSPRYLPSEYLDPNDRLWRLRKDRAGRAVYVAADVEDRS